MPEEKTDKKQERRISLFDPSIGAYREFPESIVRKFIKSAKEAEKKLKEKK